MIRRLFRTANDERRLNRDDSLREGFLTGLLAGAIGCFLIGLLLAIFARRSPTSHSKPFEKDTALSGTNGSAGPVEAVPAHRRDES